MITGFGSIRCFRYGSDAVEGCKVPGRRLEMPQNQDFSHFLHYLWVLRRPKQDKIPGI